MPRELQIWKKIFILEYHCYIYHDRTADHTFWRQIIPNKTVDSKADER